MRSTRLRKTRTWGQSPAQTQEVNVNAVATMQKLEENKNVWYCRKIRKTVNCEITGKQVEIRVFGIKKS